MRKLPYKLAIAVLTFAVGLALTGLLAVRPLLHVGGVSTSTPIISKTTLMPNVPSGWPKFDVKGQFSFYLPPDMEEGMPPDVSQADRVFNRKFGSPENLRLHLSYAYGKKVTCGINGRVQRSEVMVSGKPAWLQVWEEDEYASGIYPRMTLCFPNVGHGNKLYFYAAGKVEEARTIFSSIEFQ